MLGEAHRGATIDFGGSPNFFFGVKLACYFEAGTLPFYRLEPSERLTGRICNELSFDRVTASQSSSTIAVVESAKLETFEDDESQFRYSKQVKCMPRL